MFPVIVGSDLPVTTNRPSLLESDWNVSYAKIKLKCSTS